jgi:hypothetical protein
MNEERIGKHDDRCHRDCRHYAHDGNDESLHENMAHAIAKNARQANTSNRNDQRRSFGDIASHDSWNAGFQGLPTCGIQDGSFILHPD